MSQYLLGGAKKSEWKIIQSTYEVFLRSYQQRQYWGTAHREQRNKRLRILIYVSVLHWNYSKGKFCLKNQSANPFWSRLHKQRVDFSGFAFFPAVLSRVLLLDSNSSLSVLLACTVVCCVSGTGSDQPTGAPNFQRNSYLHAERNCEI
jgi:hypothetical protein